MIVQPDHRLLIDCLCSAIKLSMRVEVVTRNSMGHLPGYIVCTKMARLMRGNPPPRQQQDCTAKLGNRDSAPLPDEVKDITNLRDHISMGNQPLRRRKKTPNQNMQIYNFPKEGLHSDMQYTKKCTTGFCNSSTCECTRCKT